jgi:hypothetical protein
VLFLFGTIIIMVLVCTAQYGWKLPKANTANVQR